MVSEEVKKRIENGVELAKKKDYRAACDEFESASMRIFEKTRVSDETYALSLTDALLGIETLKNAGLCYKSFGELEKAVERYAKSRHVAVTILEHTKDESEAEQVAAVLRKMTPDELEWFTLGNDLFKKGDYEKAVFCFDGAINRNPDNYKPWDNKGTALMELDRIEEAVDCYEKSIQINKKNHVAMNNIAIALGKLGKVEKSLKYIDAAVAIEPGNATYHATRGNTLGALGKYEDARKEFDIALEINPECASALNGRKHLENIA
jgi:tetratricopeptide (TPR) repeat protein